MQVYTGSIAKPSCHYKRNSPHICAAQQVYCLPDSYEVEDRSLEVIRYVLNPTFRHEEVRQTRVQLYTLKSVPHTLVA